MQEAAGAGGVRDPLELLAGENATVGPLIQAFSFLAVATSFIGFVLGLTDFISDNLKVMAVLVLPLVRVARHLGRCHCQGL